MHKKDEETEVGESKNEGRKEKETGRHRETKNKMQEHANRETKKEIRCCQIKAPSHLGFPLLSK